MVKELIDYNAIGYLHSLYNIMYRSMIILLRPIHNKAERHN